MQSYVPKADGIFRSRIFLLQSQSEQYQCNNVAILPQHEAFIDYTIVLFAPETLPLFKITMTLTTLHLKTGCERRRWRVLCQKFVWLVLVFNLHPTWQSHLLSTVINQCHATNFLQLIRDNIDSLTKELLSFCIGNNRNLKMNSTIAFTL